MTPNIAGYWTGEINGTNQGGFTLELKQKGEIVTGIAKIHEPALGRYDCNVVGVVKETITFDLKPGRQPGNLLLGTIQVVCVLEEDGSLLGRWKSSIQTEGTIKARRFDQKKLNSDLPTKNSVFLVHGHDEGPKHAVARFVEQLGIKPVILQEQINSGMTVIEKFEDFASRAGYAIILMTPDDIGYPVAREEKKKHRPRQNVVLELGYFVAKLGRKKTFVLTKGEIEIPSDYFGIVYEAMDQSEGWKMRLAKELKTAGFAVDLNQAI